MSINDDLRKIATDMETKQQEINDLAEKYQNLVDKKMEESSQFMKGVCPVCNGQGWIPSREGEGKKQLCPGCNGREWTWFQIWSEEE